MKTRRLLPFLLLAAGLAALVPTERALRQARAAASHGAAARYGSPTTSQAGKSGA